MSRKTMRRLACMKMRGWLPGLALSVAVCAAPVIAAPPSSWPLFRGDHRQTGRANSVVPEQPVLLWAIRGSSADRTSADSISSQGLAAGIESTAAVFDGMVYSGNLDGHLYAVDLGSGELRWAFAARREIKSSAAVAAGRVIFGDESGRLYALDATTGELGWTFDAEGGITSSAHPQGDRVLFGSYDGRIYCLALADGAPIWTVETEGYVHGTPAIFDSTVVTAGCDGYLRMLDLATGQDEGTVELATYVGASCAIDGDGRAYFGTFGNQVLAVDITTGEVLWRYQHPTRQQPFYASAAVTEQIVAVAGRDQTVHGLDRQTGVARWLFNAGARVDSSPVISGDRLFFGSSQGIVHALDVHSGTEVWRYETGAAIVASAAVADGKLVIGSDDGVLYCFGARD